jgi:NAD(P)-dependent dehydrogenase (short-subunit alcohol dehydrogenase family)
MNNLFNLEGKNIILTGGAGMLGSYFSRTLVDNGANLAILDLNQQAVTKLANELKSDHSKVIGIECDVSNELSVENAVQGVISEFGRIDVLINNAATKSDDLKAFFQPFEKYSLETWQKIMSVNIDGMFLMAKHVGAHMIDNKIPGSIIQTSSIYGVVAPDQRIYEGSDYLGMKINTPAVYSASKAAVIGLTQYLASYWGAAGIRVNTITPGGIKSGQNETFIKNYSNRIPLGRMGEPTDLFGALIFLSSDSSRYITGQNIIVDGGLTCW